MKKKLSILFFILGIIMILLGIFIPVYIKISKFNKQTRENTEIITRDYEVFKEKVELFNTERNTYYEQVANNLYVESAGVDYENWNPIVISYGESVNQVVSSSSNLVGLCKKPYSDEEITNKCKAFFIAYETVVNYFTKDIITYNEVLNEYNSSVEDNKKLDLFELKYDYTDINEDGNFIGKD